jgi:imidazole glycerol-phosphate synthase subunit HisH
MIGIVDYDLGNIQAFANIYKRLNIPAEIASTQQELRRAEKIILPGVGAFDWAMTRLNKSGLRDTLEDMVVGDGKPVLGICSGMQMMANRSDEGQLQGLGWIDADVKKFDHAKLSNKTHLPHMGWNDVLPQGSAGSSKGLFRNLESKARFYFLHSYYFTPHNQDHVNAVTDYGSLFASSVCSGNVFGVQFHPEKSHEWGIQLLKNFAEI